MFTFIIFCISVVVSACFGGFIGVILDLILWAILLGANE
jgi:hypothetical protein